MNKKMFCILTGIMLITACVFAAENTITGDDYLKMSKRQRSETISALIKGAKQDGVVIKKSAIFYCKALDAFYARHPNMTKQPLPTVLKTRVIMEYDWDQKGVDKDKLAKDWLGEEHYKKNKARLGIK